MTYPVGPKPSTAYVEGTVSEAQGQSEASIRNGLRAKATNGFGIAQQGFGGIFSGILSMIGNLNAIVDEQVTQAGEITDDLTDLENRVELLEGGALQVRTYAFNSTWVKPANLYRLGVAVEGGGSAGRTGSTVANSVGGLGGESGGYRFEWFEEAAIQDIPNTVEVTIGAGGQTPSQIGGISRFGSLLQSVRGIGAVLTIEGSQLSNSAAGRGGQGANVRNANTGIEETQAEAGGSSAFGAGGAGGSGNGNGAKGSDAAISPTTRGNGGSGGGGGSSAVGSGGRGGDGGFPAGAGGGGGAANAFGTVNGAGGLGADGRVTLLEYLRETA